MTLQRYALALLLATAAAAAAQEVDHPQLARRVQLLVRQLDADQLSERIEAQRRLIELGPDALPLLPPDTSRMSAEMRQRLVQVRRKLEKAAAARAAEAALVTLEGRMPLAAALESLEKQSGNKTSGYPQPGPMVEVSAQGQPYWKVLDQLLDQAQLTVAEFGQTPGTLQLVRRPGAMLPRSGRAYYGGIFRFEATRVEAIRSLRNPALSGLQVVVQVAWEPRVTPISLAVRTDQIKAVDEHGKPIAPAGGQQQLEALVQRELPAVEFSLPLQLPDRSANRIARLTGTMMAMLPAEIATFEFGNLETARDVTQRQAGVAITLERMRNNAGLYEVRVGVHFDNAANALESHRGWVYDNQAYLLDRAGNKIEPSTLEATRQRPDEVGLAYVFDLPQGPAGCKFVYKTPAGILTPTVPFRLTDIPLP